MPDRGAEAAVAGQAAAQFPHQALAQRDGITLHHDIEILHRAAQQQVAHHAAHQVERQFGRLGLGRRRIQPAQIPNGKSGLQFGCQGDALAGLAGGQHLVQ